MKKPPPLPGRLMPEAEILRRRAERAATAPKAKKTKRGRPRLGIDGAIRDAEIRLMVEREMATGLSVTRAQQRVKRSQGITLRQVREAWQRIGPFKRSDGTANWATESKSEYEFNAVKGQWQLKPDDMAEAAADLERATGKKPAE